MKDLQFSDSVIPLLYLMAILAFGFQYSSRFDRRTKSHFRWGLITKTGGAFLFFGLYQFYFMVGDTFTYLDGASQLFNTFMVNPNNGFNNLMLPAGEQNLVKAGLTIHYGSFMGLPEWTLTKVAATLNIFCFNNPICLTLLFSLITFFGSWELYRYFRDRHPHLANWLFAAIFLFPSVMIWTTGVLKDTLCLGLIGYMYVAFRKLSPNRFLKPLLILVLAGTLMYLIKPYLAITFAICLAIGALGISLKERQAYLRPLALTSILLLSVPLLLEMPTAIKAWEKQDDYQRNIYKLRGYHRQFDDGRAGAQSHYSLGDFEYTTSGLLKKAPISVLTGVFRPFPWESNRLMVLSMSMENLVYSLALLWIILSPTFWTRSIKILGDPDVLFTIAFVLLLGFVVGITASNFGLLMRVKTPFLPFLGVSLVLIHHRIRKESWLKVT